MLGDNGRRLVFRRRVRILGGKKNRPESLMHVQHILWVTVVCLRSYDCWFYSCTGYLTVGQWFPFYRDPQLLTQSLFLSLDSCIILVGSSL